MRHPAAETTTSGLTQRTICGKIVRSLGSRQSFLVPVIGKRSAAGALHDSHSACKAAGHGGDRPVCPASASGSGAGLREFQAV